MSPVFLEGSCSRSDTSQKVFHIAARYVSENRDIRTWVTLCGQKKQLCNKHGTLSVLLFIEKEQQAEQHYFCARQ